VIFPNSTLYDTHNFYWSERQSDLSPSCFVAPNTAQDVSTAVKVLTRHNAPFTVKGGGHTPFEGASSIEDGVTITLASLTDITVSADRKTVSVGAGNRWINVSEALDPLGLAVVGGRSATVGVSGLTLGGGISYFSGTRGWACDNVRNYEIVLASGEIVNASPVTNRDLFWALRGGGGTNFGIVTRFDLAAHEQGDLWASSLIWPGSVNTTLIPLLHDLLVRNLVADPAAHLYFILVNDASLGGYAVVSDQFHSIHANISPPAVFSPFHDVPALSVNTRMANVSRLSRDIEQAFGGRTTWWDTTVAATASPNLLLDIVPLFEAHVTRLRAVAEPVNSTMTPFMVFQPITLNILQAMQVNGGNALGLKPEDGPIMIVQVNVMWSSPLLDAAVEESCGRLIREIDTLAAERGARSKNGYIYMNYAGRPQDVYAGYGLESLARLRKTARKWDPNGEFRKLWKGYFKL
jgi:hypothetical protein